MQECNMRILTRIYNGNKYFPTLIPVHDELNDDILSISIGPGFSGFTLCNDNTAKCDLLLDDMHLDNEFLENYETWLEEEVYNENEEIKQIQIDTPAPMTPYPENQKSGISVEELTIEINKLYIEQLNAEFKPSPPLNFNTLLLPSNNNNNHDYESTPLPKKITPLAKYTGDENNLIYIKRNDSKKKLNTFTIQEIENNYMQIEDQLLQHLMQVEDKTVQEWISQKLTAAAERGEEEQDSIYNFKILDSELLQFITEEEEQYWSTTTSSGTSESEENNNYYYLLKQQQEKKNIVTFFNPVK